jgi:DNA-binding winged helix-turn-helix (wHTH) protein/TolB-like protein/Tfp pilus assembly protein PilF
MNKQGNHFYEFEDFRLDAARGVLFRGERVVNITPKAIEILSHLVEKRGEAVSKEEIFARVWPDSFVEEANLSHHIFKLRKALEEDGGAKLIETVSKRGYRFVGKLREPSEQTAPAVETNKTLDWKIPAIAAILLVVAGAIGWFALSRKAVDTSPPVAALQSTIAVLPFVNESGDESIEYLAEGIAESLIGRLSGTESLRVKPYSAVSRYKKTAETPESIGAELNVELVLSGRMTKRGESVRLFLSLIDVASGYQTWGKQYERGVGTLATLQGEIIQDVSDYLPGKLPGSANDTATRNSEAYGLYLKGRYQLNRKTPDGIRKAIEHFNEAVAVDSSYALAYSGIADAYNQMGLWVTHPPAETFPKAKAAAEHALSLDNKLAEARTALALAKFYYDWDFAGAERDLRQAIRDNPDYPAARESFGIVIYESNPSRLDEALAELNAANSIDPVALAPYFWRGALYYFEGKHDVALRELQEAQNIDPNFTLGLALKGAVFREQGQHDKYLDNWLNASPLEGVDLSEIEIKALRAAYAANGTKAYEIAYAELLQRKLRGKYVSPVFVAMHYSLAGETDLAIEWLEKAFADRSSWLVELKVDPAWRNLHSDPRYEDLIKRIGFPE